MAASILRSRQSVAAILRPRSATTFSLGSSTILKLNSRRYASTSSSGGTDSLLLSRLRTVFLGTSIAASLYVVYLYATDTRASVHRWVVPPLLRFLYPDAEDAHHAGTKALKTLYGLNLHPRERPEASSNGTTDGTLSVSVFGTTIANPLGISAGLDKDAEIPDALFALGPSIVEVGGCTLLPQDGNPKPRVFRVRDIEGMINRYGLNSRGADAMAARLRDRLRTYARSLGLTEEEVLNGQGVEGTPAGSLYPGKLLLVQIAKNKKTDEKNVNAVIHDYVSCVSRLAPYADVLVVNVSSPNTPGLRDLQATEPLTRLLTAVVDEAKRTDRKQKPRVMVKVSPDEDDAAQMEGVVQAVWLSGVDGVIVGNTTKRRTGLVPEGQKLPPKDQRALAEEGGFSGPAMFERTLDMVGRYRKLLDNPSLRSASELRTVSDGAPVPAVDGTVSGTLTAGLSQPEPEQKVIFATGGITNGSQVLKILNAGASVAMVYTGLVYGGAGTITRIKGELKDAVSRTA